LYRIGSFPEWTQLASLLTRPAGALRITPARDAGGDGRRCRWYEVSAEATRERICWSPALKLALVVQHRDHDRWSEVVTVDEIATGPIAPAVFQQRPAAVIDLDHDLD
jgi:hypothetical protein